MKGYNDFDKGDKKSAKELKPCPFCGGKAELITNYINHKKTFFYVLCIECNAAAKEYSDNVVFNKAGKEQAIAAWNKRGVE